MMNEVRQNRSEAKKLHGWCGAENATSAKPRRGSLLYKMKTYAYAVYWARVGKSCRRVIWHQELEAGGTFQCEEDVEQIKNKVLDILKTYASDACEWDYAATESCEPNANGHWRNVCKDIEVNAFAPCDCKKGNMVRVRAFEDWNSWLKSI